MKKYKILLFDLDNTLLSFSQAEIVAFKETFKENSLPYSNDLFSRYQKINEVLWRRLEKGEIDLNYLGPYRFKKIFEEYQIVADPAKVNQSFFHHLTYQHQTLPQMEEVLEHFKEKRIFIVTNGEPSIQRQRYQDSGLHNLCEGMFISEELGFKKPQREFFEKANETIKGNKEEMLLIGDSLSSDILGGINYGIDTCWLVDKVKINKTKIIPTYRIEKLTDLYALLG